MRKVVVYRGSPPTQRQLHYIDVLARRTGSERPRPRTRGEASEYIAQLQRRRDAARRGVPGGRRLRDRLRRLLRKVHGLPPEVPYAVKAPSSKETRTR